MKKILNSAKVAVMQPYFFPYIGYYQLVCASDIFVFYDDVHYIKRGWINRNRILVNGAPSYITVSLQGASQNKHIRDIGLLDNRRKLLRSIELAYGKAPYFRQAMKPVREVLEAPAQNIAQLAMHSVTAVMNYLGIHREYRVSGDDFAETRALDRADRLIAITMACGARRYINAPGGRELYKESYFREKGIELTFLEPRIQPYAQSNKTFVAGLSIIDVIMFNNPTRTVELIQGYNKI